MTDLLATVPETVPGTVPGTAPATAFETADTIVCAVGDDGSPAAIDLAGREARRTGARLHLVHVTADPDGTRTDALLLDAMVTLHALHPGVSVTRDIVDPDGDGLAAGLAGTARARYVVIERTRKGPVHRVLTGSTADGVALRVTAPVLSVPPGWRSEGAPPPVLTVAVQDTHEVTELVGLGAAEAVARGLDLVVLHASSGGPDRVPVDELDSAVREALVVHPGVDVHLEITTDRPVDAVVGATARSALMVLGRRHHEHAWGTHLGPVVRRVLLDAACPVLLAPESRVPAPDRPAAPPARQTIVESRLVPGDVMLAVGQDDAGGAVRFAVAEAGARGVGVHLVHVVRMPDTDGASHAQVRTDAVARGASLLEHAATQARAAGGTDLRLTRRLVEEGALVRSLVAEGSLAGTIVVQHRRLGAVRRLVSWSVTNGLAARSDVAVIAVPADWSAGPERVGCVVVGLQDPDDLDDILPTAFDAAARRGIPLRVVHAGRLSPGQDEALVAAIEALRRERPDVTVHRVVEDRYPVDLLIGAVTTAELVVVGRRRHGLARRSHLGPVARDVLDRSPFPVLLAAPTLPVRVTAPWSSVVTAHLVASRVA